ncbi:MAG TPA: DUF4180 domain-containing protein [Clostridia bacterium]|nr:DUF4180 domain-containing protein [Clostridia bacterium]
MEWKIVEKNGVQAALAQGEGPLLSDVQNALDLIAAASYEAGVSRIAFCKEQVHLDFFRLGTGLAGDVLQKFTNYGVKAAFYGDFDALCEKSEPFRAFVKESNAGNSVFFVKSENEAMERLLTAR